MQIFEIQKSVTCKLRVENCKLKMLKQIPTTVIETFLKTIFLRNHLFRKNILRRERWQK